MPLSETAQLVVQLNLDDNLTPRITAAGAASEASAQAMLTAFNEANKGALTLGDNVALTGQRIKDEIGNAGDSIRASLGNAGDTLAGFGNTLESSRTKIREFGRAGSELAIVASFIGSDFKDALGPVGEFIHVAGDAGLVLTTIADIGPAVLAGSLSAARGILSIGDAAATATPELVAFASAEDIARANAVGLGSLAFGIAAVGAVGTAAAVGLEQYSEAQDRALKSTREQARAQEEANAINAAFPNLASSMAAAAQTLSGGFDALTGHVDESSRTLTALVYPITQAAGNLQSMGNDINALGGALDNSFTPSVIRGKDETQGLIDTLLKIPTTIDSTVRVNIIQTVSGVGAMPTAQPLTAGGGANPNLALDANGRVVTIGGDTGAHGDTSAADAARAAAARARQQALDEAARKAAQAAAEAQRAIEQAIRDRYQTAKQLEDDYFSKVHQNNLKAIQEEHDKAQAQHDAAIAAINDQLATQLALNAQPVTAAQAALQDVQNQEQLRNLQEAVNRAFTAAQQNPNDPEAQTRLRDAREALANFNAQLKINALQQQQAVADAKARHDAAVATQKADAALAAADAKQKHDIIVENGRYETQQRNFNNAMQKILDDTVKKHQSFNTALQRLIDLIDRYAGKPLPTKEQQARTAETVHVVNVNVPPITIGARAVTNAISTQVSPTQSPYVRTAQARPKFSPT